MKIMKNPIGAVKIAAAVALLGASAGTSLADQENRTADGAPAVMLRDDFVKLDGQVWKKTGRGEAGIHGGVLRVKDCFLMAGGEEWKDYEMRFRARAPESAEQVQIWSGFRCRDRDNRYALGMRGGNHDDLYLAWYSPEGNDEFLAIEPLEFHPEPGTWYDFRVVVRGPEIRVYLNDEPMPRINVTHKANGPAVGGCVLGGGWIETEFDDLRITRATGGAVSFNPNAIKINFQPADAPPVDGWKVDAGEPYDAARGYGWDRQVFTRKRNAAADPLSDSLAGIAHEQTKGEFRYDLPAGDYLVTLQAGDPSHPSAARVSFNDNDALPAERSIDAGGNARLSGSVHLAEDALRLSFTRPPSGRGLSLNWLVIEKRADLPPERWLASLAKNKPQDESGKREEQRAAYQPVSIRSFTRPREEYPLDGNWLFLPDYEWPEQGNPASPGFSDADWHVIDVPNFWNPLRNWLHGEQGGMRSGDKGVSDNFFQLENARCADYTFDWEHTDGAWYRHHLVLPGDLGDRHFELCFDAIAKVSELWVNGKRLGSHLGMFGEFRVDVTDALRPGENLIAVRVLATAGDASADADEIVGVAVTVEVTNAMLNSLPQAIYPGRHGGIWQPVKLIATSPVRVEDVFARTRLDGADVDVTVGNSGAARSAIDVAMEIVPVGGGEAIFASKRPETISLDAGKTAKVTLKTGHIAPQPWSPHSPSLYRVRVTLSSGGTVLDVHDTTTGFRTFEARGNKLYLNGKPYWLRGGNHSPMAIRPNDAKLADKYTRLMKEGNMNITRTVCSPYNEVWLEASDRIGAGVSYEGTWPWLMLLGSPIPDPQLLEIWQREFASLIRKYRNHPSILMWTVNNEMKFPFGDHNPSRRNAKWRILTDMIETMRELDPTRPIVADSSYTRRHAKARPEWSDDGDIDDIHAYNGWYQPSFFHLYNTDYIRLGHALPDRPFISQEFSTGYPNNDSGHPTRYYLFPHQNPQSLVGDYAYEHQDPAHFLKRQAFITKETAETLRRYNRNAAAGFMHFASVCWFRDVYDADRIAPYPTYYDIQRALQPVLVSAELFGRHRYAGDSMTRRVCIVNDREDGMDLPETVLEWEIRCDSGVLAKGSQPVGPVAYYANRWVDVAFEMPKELPAPRTEAQLVLKLSGDGRVDSENAYDLTLATREWATRGKLLEGRRIGVFDPAGKWAASLRESGCEVVPVTKLGELDSAKFKTLIVADPGSATPAGYDRIKAFAQRGGRVLLSRNHKHVKSLLPDQVMSFNSRQGEEIVTMNIPESPVFDGILPGDMSWFEVTQPKVPMAATGFFHLRRERPELDVLAETSRIHGYLQPGSRDSFGGSPVFEVKTGDGAILVSEMLLDAAEVDPIAGRLMTNMIHHLTAGPDR